MSSVHVDPLPTVDRQALKAVLSDQQNGVRNAGNVNGLPDRLFKYLDWATEATRQLNSYLRPESVNQLVATRRYEHLLTAGPSLIGDDILQQRVLNGLISAEVAERIAAFDQAIKAVDLRINRWSQNAMFVVGDTNFYMQHEKEFDEIDFSGIVEAGDLKTGGGNIHLIIPLAVIDELDKQKRRTEVPKRTRARRTLAIIDRLFKDPDDQPYLTPREGQSASVPVTLELLFDPPDHVRLPSTDDEIIDQMVAAQPMAARDIFLLTFDSGMAMRARKARLKVIKLEEPEAPERAPRRRRDLGTQFPGPSKPLPSER